MSDVSADTYMYCSNDPIHKSPEAVFTYAMCAIYGPELESAQMIYFIMISCSSESNYLDEQVGTLIDLTKKYMVLMKP
jgi:hypothetical protein